MCVLTKRERKETAMDAKLVGEKIKNGYVTTIS